MHTEREKWEQLLANLPEQRMTQPGVVGKWSIKDVITHLTVWETWASNLVKAAIQGQETTSSEVFATPIPPEVDALDVDSFNEWIVEHGKVKSLAEVIIASRTAFENLVETVETLSEDDLTNSERQFVGLEWKGSRPLWDIIANQSYLHYQLHATSIHRWLDELSI